MMFSIPAACSVAGVVVISGIAAGIDGTFTSRTVRMGFASHWGMWSDLVLLPIVVGLILPVINPSPIAAGAACAAAGTITIVAHKIWADWFRAAAITGHLFRNQSGRLMRDLSVAGWLHVAVMTGVLAVALLYAVTPCPWRVTWIVSVLLTVHVVVSAVQPGWHCTRVMWSRRNVLPPLSFAAAIWLLALWKAAHAQST